MCTQHTVHLPRICSMCRHIYVWRVCVCVYGCAFDAFIVRINYYTRTSIYRSDDSEQWFDSFPGLIMPLVKYIIFIYSIPLFHIPANTQMQGFIIILFDVAYNFISFDLKIYLLRGDLRDILYILSFTLSRYLSLSTRCSVLFG